MKGTKLVYRRLFLRTAVVAKFHDFFRELLNFENKLSAITFVIFFRFQKKKCCNSIRNLRKVCSSDLCQLNMSKFIAI